ncbi:hypothetical protein GMB86_03495 [Terrilactibacillus sp. BCM23-1]|uniref:Uncharacterized protein n=1 Tax=Terrilactibacillus tamarindi TaxID=2599694 RepID=A0A6N8CM51_9BACI|nr:hypothetical protein [Terrilactibacillus tamarindi]MTT31079.1 hypothetical protein [Terrilactibacillus tamarindi]
MKTRQSVVFLLFSILLILIHPAKSFATASPAGPSEWDKVGQEDLSLKKYRNDYTKNYSSNGGNFKICISGLQRDNAFAVMVYEYDPAAYDKRIATFIVNSNSCYSFSTSKYIDGDNRKAEVYFKINSPNYEQNVTAKFYD